MNFLRLSDDLVSILYEDDDIIAIDKPYGFNCHTNESKVGNADFIQHGLIEILERQLNRKLHVVHRLDRTTTGVVIFGKSQDAAKKYAEYFFFRKVEKNYQFLTAAIQGPQVTQFEIDAKIVYKGKSLTAKTEFTWVAGSSRFALWQARPMTGRNHQIRIHAQAGGIPVLGDKLYGGESYPFLCLHNRKMVFPSGVVLEAEPPAYFSDLSILEDVEFSSLLHHGDRRQRLFATRNPKLNNAEECFRLAHHQKRMNGAGFSIDQYSNSMVMLTDQDFSSITERRSFEKYAEMKRKPMYVRITPESKGSSSETRHVLQPDARQPISEFNWTAHEHGVFFAIDVTGNSAVGLQTDMRIHRKWLRENSRDKSLLNLFSSTCSFAVCAALGGAKETISIESNKSALGRGRKNFEANGFDLENSKPHQLLLRDPLIYLNGCLKKGSKFDIVVCQVPSFYRGEKAKFQIDVDFDVLLKSLLQVIEARGFLLLLTHSQSLYNADIRMALSRVQSELALDIEVSCLLSALDLELVSEAPHLKAFLIQRLS
jgi:23S rRNA (cytosine1962-C5)-methyltransferase